jgi:recombination protein RecT
VTQTVSTAVAKQEQGPSALITQYRDDFATVLPSHVKADTWVRLATGVLRRDQKLLKAAQNNPASLMSALLNAARMGLEPGTEQFYLTPRSVKGQDGKYQDEILGIVGYQGEIELMYRAGAVSSIIVEAVYSNDRFTYSPGRDERPVHEIDWDSDDRGHLRLVYAYAVMKDGATSKVVVLNKHHIAAAKASSQGSGKEYSPWVKHTEAMWLKTAAHRLRKWVPTSAEYRTTMQAATVAATDVADRREIPMPAHDPATGEVVEAELVDEPAATEVRGAMRNSAAHSFLYDGEADDGTCATCGAPEDAEAHGG